MKNSGIRLPLNHENCILLPPQALLGLWLLPPLQAVICLMLTAAGMGSRAGLPGLCAKAREEPEHGSGPQDPSVGCTEIYHIHLITFHKSCVTPQHALKPEFLSRWTDLSAFPCSKRTTALIGYCWEEPGSTHGFCPWGARQRADCQQAAQTTPDCN